MHEYDTALKCIIASPGSALQAALTGSGSIRWLNVETPKVRNLRVDLLGALPGGGLVQIEFQSRNEKNFAIRMGEYLFAIGRKHGRLPRQIVLYVGRPAMRMKSSIEGPDLSFRYHLIDIRELDGEALLASANLGDNVLSLLTKLGDQPDAVKRILERIAQGPVNDREQAIAELLILSGLRKRVDEVRRETKIMPIHYSIMDHAVIGPAIRQGRAEGQVDLLLSQVRKRFGSAPPSLKKRLAELNSKQLKEVGLRLLDARSVEDLLGN